jgi:hypothetical protein
MHLLRLLTFVYMFYWVSPRRQIKFCQRFGTLCQVHLQRHDVAYEVWMMRGKCVINICTVSGLVWGGRANGGGRHQVLGGSGWKGSCGVGGIKEACLVANGLLCMLHFSFNLSLLAVCCSITKAHIQISWSVITFSSVLIPRWQMTIYLHTCRNVGLRIFPDSNMLTSRLKHDCQNS